MPNEADNENVIIVEAPEQTEAMENENFIVEVFVPVLPDGENIAPDAEVTANGFNQGFNTKKANDEDVTAGSYWEGTPNEYPNEIALNFSKVVNAHAIRICLNPDSIWGKRTQTFTVSISQDGESFEEFIPSTVYSFDPETGNEVIIEFDTAAMKSVMLTFTDNTGANAGQVAEFELYSEDYVWEE